MNEFYVATQVPSPKVSIMYMQIFQNPTPSLKKNPKYKRFLVSTTSIQIKVMTIFLAGKGCFNPCPHHTSNIYFSSSSLILC